MKTFIKNHWILLSCLAFLGIIKIPHLSLPMSWDEAWSYYPAILKMVENGPSLITGSIPIHDSKGHPLLFYFLESGWITIFSNKFWIVRLLPLLVSASTILALYLFVKTHFSKKTANYTIAIFTVQSLFLAQATLLLPEVLLTLFLILSLHFFFSNKFGYYAILSSLMVLTKETGLIFAAGFGFFYFYENFRKIANRDVLIRILFLLIPLFTFLVHLLLNYIAFNSFFFSEHLELITIDIDEIKRILTSSIAILFTMYGRNVILGIAIISTSILLFKKRKIQISRILLLIIVLMVILILFSSVNFYTYRYMLPAFPLFILLSAELFNQVSTKSKLIQFIGITIMIATPLYSTLTNRGKLDVDFGYTIYLPLHKEIVQFCEKQDWENKIFSSEFNMLLALRDPFTGYHSTDIIFQTQHLPKIKNADIVILDSTGEFKTLPENERDNFFLVKRFEKENHWGEIYQRK